MVQQIGDVLIEERNMGNPQEVVSVYWVKDGRNEFSQYLMRDHNNGALSMIDDRDIASNQFYKPIDSTPRFLGDESGIIRNCYLKSLSERLSELLKGDSEIFERWKYINRVGNVFTFDSLEGNPLYEVLADDGIERFLSDRSTPVVIALPHDPQNSLLELTLADMFNVRDRFGTMNYSRDGNRSSMRLKDYNYELLKVDS